MYTKSTYDEVCHVLRSTHDKAWTSREYGWRRELQLFEFNNLDVIGRKNVVAAYVANHGIKNERYAPKLCYFDQIFDSIYDAHEETQHAKIEKTHTTVQLKYSNISRKMVATFIEMCPTCAKDKSIPSRMSVRKPIMSDTFNDRGQIDLIDMQSCSDGPYKWILHYQDHMTKFSYLRALRKKCKLEYLV